MFAVYLSLALSFSHGEPSQRIMLMLFVNEIACKRVYKRALIHTNSPTPKAEMEKVPETDAAIIRVHKSTKQMNEINNIRRERKNRSSVKEHGGQKFFNNI